MSSKSYPSDVVEQGRAVLEAWRSIDPALKVGELAPEALEADLQQIAPALSQIDKLEAQLTDARNTREALSMAMWDKVKRLRRGVQAIYGDDSSQYEVVGGTRLSDRKPVARATKPTA
jgi:hypothetical protein